MERRDNYRIQAQQAKALFLTYDQTRLIEKFRLKADTEYLFVNFLCKLHRIDRYTGDISVWKDGQWIDSNGYNVVMTLFDLLCDSKPDRYLAGRLRSMESFGKLFHQNLTDEDPRAVRIQQRPEAFQRACTALGARQVAGADMGYGLELFDGLELVLLFWYGDEDFAPRLRFYWDENALQYLRYETMYFAVGQVMQEIFQHMDGKGCGRSNNGR